MNQNDDRHLEKDQVENDQVENDLAVAAEVEQLESWFADVSKQFPEPPCRVLEHVKMRTNVAVGELRLEEVTSPLASGLNSSSADAIALTKSAVRREFAGAKSADQPAASKSNGLAWGALMTLASAALIAIVVLPGFLKSTTSVREGEPIAEASAVDDWAYVLTATSSSEFDDRVAGFESDIDDVSDAFVSSQVLADELGFDEIEDAIDQLYSDSDSFLDS